MSDAEVEARLFTQVGRNEPAARAPIDFGWVHMELRRAGVTLELLWTEYQQAVADGGSGLQAVPVQPVLRAVPGVREEALAGDAADAPRGGEGVHRLLRQEAAARRSRDGGGRPRSSCS